MDAANSTAFGLASTVMSKDAHLARRVANKIRAGAVYATSTGFGILFEFPNVQRGGFGCSGIGRELGLAGLHEYTELKSINYSGVAAPQGTPPAPKPTLSVSGLAILVAIALPAFLRR